VAGALVLPDGQLLSWGYDKTLRVWNLSTGLGRALTGHTGPVSGALALPDGQLLSWSDDGILRVWNVATGEGRALTGHTQRVLGAGVLSDRQFLSWSDDETLRVWDGQRQVCAFRFDAAPAAVVPCGESQVFVGDSLGRVHFMELIASRA
jgi:WD40 repeat protein